MATYHPQGIEGNNGLDSFLIPFTSSVNPPHGIYPNPYPVLPSNSIDSSFQPANKGIFPVMYLGPLGGGVLVPADENTIHRLNPDLSAPFLESNFPALTLAP